MPNEDIIVRPPPPQKRFDLPQIIIDQSRSPPLANQTTKSSNTTTAVILKSIILNIYIKYDREKLVESLIDELLLPCPYLPKDANGTHLSVLHQYVLNSTCDSIDMSNQSKRLSYQPNLIIRKNDALGPWTFNYLLTLLSLKYQCDPADRAEFPPVWKTDSTTKVQIEPIPNYQTDANASISTKKDDDVSLEGLFKVICQQNQRNERSAAEWLKPFQEESITTVEHLRAAIANETLWDHIQSVKHIVKQMIKDYVLLNDPTLSKNQSNSEYDTSDATLYADIHRIRRYFHHVTKTVKYVTLLDREAVDHAVIETRKTYDDDGNVLNTIHAYLRAFCLQFREMNEEAHQTRKLEWLQEKNRLADENKILQGNIDILEQEAAGARTKVNLHTLTFNNMEKDKQKAFNDAEKLNSQTAALDRSTSSKTWARQREQAKKKIEKAEKNLKDAKDRLEEAQAELILKTEPIRKKQITIAENEAKKNDLTTYYNIDGAAAHKKLKVKYGRGLLLYGPPGTGKSELLKTAAKYAGITMITTALAAGELNRPHVGETERLLVDIMHRSDTVPYLICALTIDEIDGLVPKRTNNAQQSKVDGISVLLSHIEGVKDIHNLIVLGATNRRNMMDEAFLRRMQAKCFVGRPSPAIRKKMLEPLLYMDTTVFTNQVIDFLVKITTNFSGAAVVALKSSIIVAMDTYKSTEMNEKILLDLAHNAAKEFSCWFGIGTLPEICRLYPNIFSSKVNQQEKYSLKFSNLFPTGRILVDLLDRKCLIELENDATIDEDLGEEEKSTNTLLARFINGCSSRNIDTIQIIDLNYLVKNNAFEENQIFELLTTIFEECDEYNRSMLIFDIDSLIMLSVSDSAMSKSLSISNIRLYQFIREKCKKAVVEQRSTGPTVMIQKDLPDSFFREKWIVMIVKHPLLRSLLVEDIEFKKTFRQTQQEYEDEQKHIDDETPKICPKCEKSYLPGQNNHGNCEYHDGYIVDIEKPEIILSREEAQKILQNARIAAANTSNNPSGPKAKTPKLFWSCCLAAYGNDHPCKKGVCGLPKELEGKVLNPNLDLIQIVRKHFEENITAKTKIEDFAAFYKKENPPARPERK
ncbi:unnamed protein product [Adineta steineri]|uniref:AAA+ ATPase domain-containing protein n=1 Tax=Adineta steineri TaxID=433720 RepID=A0A814ETT5_9BILA|nr:unnamed protein product [Adineta steineri]CAF3743448.1 unnamed protein product [Adineta steineri]